ncbi:MAG: creatininase family protein [Caldilineaceae bacterium]
MTVLLAELTREKIRQIAPNTIAVLPTAAIEQHGPHDPIMTDTLLCGTIAQRAAERTSATLPVVVAPVFCFGNSHHHLPFGGTLSLSSPTYLQGVTDVLLGLVNCGFRKLVVLNGHGGNTDSNAVVGLDFVHRLNQPVTIATGAYWDIARPAIVERGIMAGKLIPGHAGRFETSLVLALRPDLVDPAVLAATPEVKPQGSLFGDLSGATIQANGGWSSTPGYTDNPAAASAEEGRAMLEVIVERVSEFLLAFGRSE